MNQEMTDVPEYRNTKNAPSKQSEEEAFWKGFINGYLQAIIIVAALNANVATEALNKLDEMEKKNVECSGNTDRNCKDN